MGIFNRILGRDQPGEQWGRGTASSGASSDDQAIARYRYLVRTAPPEAIEQAHAEAFARLSPEQRRRVLAELGAELPAVERAAVERAGDDPNALARVATRAELSRPGSLERAFGRIGAPAAGGLGFGGLVAGSFLGSMAGAVLGTAIANHFLEQHADALTDADAAQGATDAGADADVADAGFDGDAGGFDGDVGGFDV
jgi:hypothetical protein